VARLVRRLDAGTLHVVASRPALLEPASDLAADAARAGTKGIQRVQLGGEDAILKSSPMHGRSALRWAAKCALLRARLPRVAEHDNLAWLAKRLFATPVPLAAGGVFRGGVPRWQFLVTRRVADGVPFETWFPSAPPDARAHVLAEIAREVARMHALRFVHHDLWPRNLLVVQHAGSPRPGVVFLDAWAGGPGFQLRGTGYDVRCFTSGMAASWTPAEARAWSAAYAAERRVGLASEPDASDPDETAR
jgi:hypothetical protein